MRLGLAKIDQQTIAQELRNVPVIAANHLRTGGLVGTDDFSVLFGVELGGEFGGINEVTKHHRKLSPFGFWDARFGWQRDTLRWLIVLDRRLWFCLEQWRSGDRYVFRCPNPDQNFSILVPGKLLCLDQFDLHILQIVLIQVKPPFEGSVRDTSLALEERDDLFENFIKRHTRSSPNSSNNALASCKSFVSNP